MSDKAFEEWAILELMGHRRLAGLVREVSIGGASFIRIDVPKVPSEQPDAFTATQFYNPAAVYCMTPVSEQLAREIARRDQPQPVSRWELAAPSKKASEDEPADGLDFEDEEEI